MNRNRKQVDNDINVVEPRLVSLAAKLFQAEYTRYPKGSMGPDAELDFGAYKVLLEVRKKYYPFEIFEKDGKFPAGVAINVSTLKSHEKCFYYFIEDSLGNNFVALVDPGEVFHTQYIVQENSTQECAFIPTKYFTLVRTDK